MNLEQYLEGIRNCPDEMVGEETMLQRMFGIFDNYDIMLNERFGKVALEFFTLTDFQFRHLSGREFVFDYKPKIVNAQISRNRLKSQELFRKHPVLITLHPRYFRQQTTSPDYKITQQHRNIAEIVQIIANYVMTDKIPALFRASYLTLPADILAGRETIIYNS